MDEFSGGGKFAMAIAAAACAGMIMRGLILLYRSNAQRARGHQSQNYGWQPSRNFRLLLGGTAFWWSSLLIMQMAGMDIIHNVSEMFSRDLGRTLALFVGPSILAIGAVALVRWVAAAQK